MRTTTTSLFRSLRGAAVALASAAALSSAASAQIAEALPPEHHHWHFSGATGTFDRAALQRGYQVYREVCASCHGMKFLAFRNLGQEAGPFFDEEFPNPNDNPKVKALAAQFTVMDGPDDSGQMFERPGRPSDALPAPFPNEQTARLANGGALPPDLSLITKARHHGPDYVRSLLIGFGRPAPADLEVPAGSYYNPWFPGGLIKMAPPLPEGRVQYEDGTEATTEQMAEDVVNFLTWASDPHTEARKRMGISVLAYLAVLTLLLYLTYKRIWRNVKH